MLRRRTYGPAAGGAALAVALALPGAAVAADGTTWVPDGRPVAGTPTAAGAPLLEPGATYRDVLTKGGTDTYRVVLGAAPADADPVTDHLSAFAVPRPGSRVGFLDGITLDLRTPDGTLCDSYDARFPGADATEPVGGAVRRPGSAAGACRAAGTYLLVVQRRSGPGSGDDAWPLDVRYLREPAADPGPEQAAPVPAYVPAAPSTVTGPALRVTGTPGMDGDGTRLPGTGVYRDSLAPGATRYYRVPVGWGQRLFATAGFGAATMTRTSGFSVTGLRVALYDPARGYVDGQTSSYTGRPASVAAQTPVVTYGNRLSSDSRVNASATAGWYYLQVSLHPSVAEYARGTVDVTLRVGVAGEPVTGPHYHGDAVAAGFDLPPSQVPDGSAVTARTPDPTDAAGPPVSAARSTGPDGSGRRTVGYGALGLAVVFTAWPTVWLARARRRGAAPR